jgi:nitrite reductase/ring-hydroxylating ferredoxin subunit
MDPERRFWRVARSDEVAAALVRRTLLGRHVGLWRDAGGAVHALEVTCRHQNADLTAGERNGSLVTCPRHGWVYDLATGACLTEPWARLRRFAVREEGGAVWVDPTPLDTGGDPDGAEDGPV